MPRVRCVANKLRMRISSGEGGIPTNLRLCERSVFSAKAPVSQTGLKEMSDFHATIDDPAYGELKQKSKVTLRLHNAHNVERVEATLTSLVDPAANTPVEVVVKTAGVYEISYIPTVRGRYDLTVKVNSTDVRGGPFRVFVRIHPSQFGDPVLTSGEMGRPYGITVASNGEVLVAQNGGNPKQLTFLDKKCRPLRSVVTDQFTFPRGVAISPDGAIFATNKQKNTIFKFDQSLKLVRAVNKGSKQVQLIKFIEGKLYICDMGNSQIHIFSHNLDFLSSFQTQEVPSPHDLAAGEDGLYVVGGCEKGAQIGVYTYEGRFLRHITTFMTSFPGNPPVRLSEMRGICFDCYGHMFVTQVGGGIGGVYVFKTSGEYVRTFGDSRAVLDYPVGIAIDEDGFVYVSDHKNVKKVHVF